jgi:hypothetical protein
MIDAREECGVGWGVVAGKELAGKEPPMTIQITRPEVEALINERLQSGAFRDAEDVILQALRSSPPTTLQPGTPPAKDIAELFAPLRGLNLDFGRNPSTGRPVDL